MQKFAKVKDGIVSNVARADHDFADREGLVPCGNEVGPGWRFDGLNFSPPSKADREAERRAKREQQLSKMTDQGSDKDRAIFNVLADLLQEVRSGQGKPMSRSEAEAEIKARIEAGLNRGRGSRP